jgi:hypothetical protein
MDYLQFYDLEGYLFQTLGPRFRAEGRLTAFDVLCIANWKAPRARTYVARRLCNLGAGNIEAGAAKLAAATQPGRPAEDRFHAVLSECGLALPMGSAILTVLDDATFSVYDRRVCDELGRFHDLPNITNAARLWPRFLDYMAAVRAEAPAHLTLRDCDRWLWARSAVGDLVRLAQRQCT